MKNYLTPYATGCFLTILIGLYSFYANQILNHDAILYLRVADIYTAQGLQAAYHLYHWPFYSLLIGAVSQVTGLSSYHAACLINILFQVGITTVFLSLIKTLGGTQRHQWVALAVIILFPTFQSYRAYIVRDFGFWLFYLLAIKACLQFVEKKTWSFALLWTFSIIAATLFRIEGLFFFLVQPLFILFIGQDPFWLRARAFLKMNTFLGIVILLGLCLVGIVHRSLWEIGRFNNIHDALYAGVKIKNNILHLSQVLSDNFLIQPGLHDAIPMAISSIIGLVIYKMVKVVHPVYALLSIYGMLKCQVGTLAQRGQLWGFMVLNSVLVLYFAALFDFLSSRYVMGFALTSLIWAPFGIERLLVKYFQQNYAFKQGRWAIVSVGIIMGYLGIYHIIHKSSDKLYVREAANFLKQKISSSQLLYTNVPQLLYDVKGASLQWDKEYDPGLTRLKTENMKNYDFYAIQLIKDDTNNINKLDHLFSPIKPVIFESHHGSQIFIYSQERES